VLQLDGAGPLYLKESLTRYNGPTSFELNGPCAKHFRRNTRVIGPCLTVSTQIASQGWDRTVRERDCHEATMIRPIKLSLSFSVHCEVARVVGTNIALPADKKNPR
jgi:hypothetical protein